MDKFNYIDTSNVVSQTKMINGDFNQRTKESYEKKERDHKELLDAIKIVGKNSETNPLSEEVSEVLPKIFVSHYSGDKEIVGCVIELLEALGFTEDNIFCSSFSPYNIPLGQNFMEEIKKQFKSNTLALFILTKEFFERPICMCEMGAAWVSARTSIPIIVPPMNYEDIKGVLKDNQGFMINCDEGLNSLYEILMKYFNRTKLNTNVWQRKKSKFIKDINTKITERTKAILSNPIVTSSTTVLKNVNKITYDNITHDEITLLQLMLTNEEGPFDIIPWWTIKEGMSNRGLTEFSYSLAIRKLLAEKIIECGTACDNNDNHCIGYNMIEKGNTYIIENSEKFSTSIPQLIPF